MTPQQFLACLRTEGWTEEKERGSPERPLRQRHGALVLTAMGGVSGDEAGQVAGLSLMIAHTGLCAAMDHIFPPVSGYGPNLYDVAWRDRPAGQVEGRPLTPDMVADLSRRLVADALSRDIAGFAASLRQVPVAQSVGAMPLAQLADLALSGQAEALAGMVTRAEAGDHPLAVLYLDTACLRRALALARACAADPLPGLWSGDIAARIARA